MATSSIFANPTFDNERQVQTLINAVESSIMSGEQRRDALKNMAYPEIRGGRVMEDAVKRIVF